MQEQRKETNFLIILKSANVKQQSVSARLSFWTFFNPNLWIILKNFKIEGGGAKDPPFPHPKLSCYILHAVTTGTFKTKADLNLKLVVCESARTSSFCSSQWNGKKVLAFKQFVSGRASKGSDDRNKNTVLETRYVVLKF